MLLLSRRYEGSEANLGLSSLCALHVNILTAFVENKHLIGFVLHFLLFGGELLPSQKGLSFSFLHASVYTPTSKQSQADSQRPPTAGRRSSGRARLCYICRGLVAWLKFHRLKPSLRTAGRAKRHFAGPSARPRPDPSLEMVHRACEDVPVM